MSQAAVVSPIPASWWPSMWTWLREYPLANFDDCGPTTYADYVAHRESRIANGEQSFGFALDDVPVGMVLCERWGQRMGVLHVCLTRPAWGCRVVTSAANEIAGQLLATGIEKVMAPIFADNVPAAVLCRQLGFTQEGHFREHALRNGVPVDVLVFGMTKSEWRRHHA